MWQHRSRTYINVAPDWSISQIRGIGISRRSIGHLKPTLIYLLRVVDRTAACAFEIKKIVTDVCILLLCGCGAPRPFWRPLLSAIGRDCYLSWEATSRRVSERVL